MTKINISISPELLELIDSEAKALGTSRSGLIQEASARYVTEVERDREAELRRRKTKAAARRMKELGTRLGLTSETDVVTLLADARAVEDARHDR